jgi:hypothetical protein
MLGQYSTYSTPDTVYLIELFTNLSYLFIFILFNNFIGAINYFKIISTISTGPKGKGANEAI